jgi:hypothetical protein
MVAPVVPRPLAAEGVAIEAMALDVVGEAGSANVSEVSAGVIHGRCAKMSATKTLGAKTRTAEMRYADMRSAEMRSAEMTATTEMATAAVATATACKSVGRGTEPAKGDGRQEHACCL